MPQYKYKEEDGLVKTATDIAGILRKNGVPCLLWDLLYLSLLGQEAAQPSDISFVIPDRDMKAALRALRAAGFSDTPVSEENQCSCRRLPGETITGPDCVLYNIPNYCFRVYETSRNAEGGDLEQQFSDMSLDNHAHIRLYLQSQWLWWLPAFGTQERMGADSHYMLASDPALPGVAPYRRNRFNPANAPVMVLTPAAYAEALIYLHARECELFKPEENPRGISHAYRILEHVSYAVPLFKDDPLDITDFSRFDDLTRQVWMFYNAADAEEDYDAYVERVQRLGKKLTKLGKLPKLPESWTWKPEH